MALPPWSPWLVAERGETDRQRVSSGSGEYEGTAMALDVPLYRMLAPHGYGPAEIDGLENWQCAAVIDGIVDHAEAMNAARAGKKHRPRPRGPRGPTPGPVPSSRRNLIAERIAHSRGEGPAPEAAPIGRDVVETLGAVGVLQPNDGDEG